MFFLIFLRVFAVCLMIGVGLFARKMGFLDSNSTRKLSFLITNFIYPAAVFSSLVGNYRTESVISQWCLPVGSFMIMGIGFTVGLVSLKFLRKLTEPERRMFHFQTTINNYLFMAMPLVMAAYGDSGVAMLSLSAFGSEISLWTLGMTAMSGGVRLKQLKKLINAPTVTIFLAMGFILLRDKLPFSIRNGIWGDSWQTLLDICKLFGAATFALPMIVAGSRMCELNYDNVFRRIQVWIALMRLLIVPFFCVMAIRYLPFPEEVRGVLYIVAVMPTSIFSVVLSDIFNADTGAAASSVMVTHVLSVFTVPVWLYLIQVF